MAGDQMNEDEALYRVRLGDCWIDGCLRDAFTRVTFHRAGGDVTGLLCDIHAEEVSK